MASILTADKINDLPAMNEYTPEAQARRAVLRRQVALFCLLALLLAFLAPRAQATCTFQPGGMTRYTISGPSSVGVRRDAINTGRWKQWTQLVANQSRSESLTPHAGDASRLKL